MRPRRTTLPVYTVRDARRALGEDEEDTETGFGGSSPAESDRGRETGLGEPLRGEGDGGRETGLGGPLRRESGGGPLPGEGDVDRQADPEGPTPRRGRRVVAVILPAATAFVVIAVALMLLRPAGGARPHVGSAEGDSRSRQTNVPATDTPAERTAPIDRASRPARQAPPLRSASPAGAGIATAPARNGRPPVRNGRRPAPTGSAAEAPEPIVPVAPIVLVDAARPSAPPVAAAEFGFER